MKFAVPESNVGFQLETERERLTGRLRLRAGVGSGRTGNPLAMLSCQPKRANAVWTRAQWTALCEHLHNGNGRTHFVMGFRDKDGAKRYVKSRKLGVDRAISWAWSSIAGSPKSRLAFVPYSTNEYQQSRWGGLDFDAHDGSADRARELALAAFRVLLNAPDLCVILETSGSGGWHVWAVSPDFYATSEWIQLLKSVARLIGAPVTAGVCEIFPPDALPSRFGKGMRAPGCWNPGTETCSEIVWENTRTSLENVLSGKSETRPLISSELQSHFPDKERSVSFSASSSGAAYRETEFLERFGIMAPKSRNGKLCALVGALFNQVGHATARRLVEAQFRGATVTPKATEAEHIASFEKLWCGLVAKWTATLTAAEREALAELATENERDAFRIIRSYARKAEQDGAPDFPIVRDNLALRLGVTGNGAAGIRDKLAARGLGVLEKTADYVPNKTSKRFRWCLNGAKPDAARANEPF